MEVKIKMSENDRDSEIRATVLAKLHREGFYQPRGVSIDAAASFGIASHDRGRAKELIREMATDDSYPLKYHVVKESVYLEQQSASWVAAKIRQHAGDEAVPWDLKG
ncbi:hypothetical protein [Natronorubrum sp. DTA7]|uniref:hypothetical protein n=1 Tax=Natronorubrum sp. DTA7 TaxID=3447016 RepID=UPI003F855D97